MTKRGEKQKEEERKRKERGGLNQLFERRMHKRSHSLLYGCGLPYVQLSLSISLCKIGNITQHTPGAIDHI